MCELQSMWLNLHRMWEDASIWYFTQQGLVSNEKITAKKPRLVEKKQHSLRTLIFWGKC